MVATGKRIRTHFDSELYVVNDTYYYRGTPYGLKRRVERSLEIKVGAAQKDILKRKKEVVESLEKAGIASGKNTFRSIGEAYKDERKEEAKDPTVLSERTLSETVSIMDNHLIPYFGTLRVEDLNHSSFNDYCKLKKREGLNLVNHRKVLNHFFKWCVHNNYLKYRIEFEIPKFAIKSRRKREVLTDEEVKSLLSVGDRKALLYIVLYLMHGMRNMEICKLRWDEIDFVKRGCFINPKSNRRRKARAIPLNDFAIKLLNELRNDSDYVFPSAKADGKKEYMDPSGGIRKRWGKALIEAKISRHITPHDLRATFETFMHSNPEFTDTQREKMAGARIDVQKEHYVRMDIEKLRGLENSVSVKGLDSIVQEQMQEISGGKLGGNKAKENPKKRASLQKQRGKSK